MFAVADFPLETSLPVLGLSEVEAIFEKKSTYQLIHPVSEDDTYYIIFTSGTTGKPKECKFRMTICSALLTG